MKNLLLLLLLITQPIYAEFFPIGGGGSGGSSSWRAPVANAAALPGSGNTAGDCITAQDSGIPYCWDGDSWEAPAGSGTVTSVAMTAPSAVFDIAGSPVTSTGTLAITFDTQTANLIFAGPGSGGAATPTFRTLVAADLPYPNLPSAQILVGNGGGTAAPVAMSGDIALANTGATSYAGTVPLNKGGTGQTTKAPAFDALQPMTTAGDIITGGASGTGTRLAIGTALQILRVNAGATALEWATGGSGGVDTMAAIGSSPNANAASISGTTLTMQPANSSFGGVVSGTTQDFLGSKTFLTAPHIFTISTGVTAPEQQFSIRGNLPAATTAFQSFLSVTSDGANGFASLGNNSTSGAVRSGLRARFTGTLSATNASANGIYWDVRGAYGGLLLSDEAGLYGGVFTTNNTSTTGINTSVRGYAYGSNQNRGGAFQAVNGSGTSPYNIGVQGMASQNTGATAAGGWFKITSTTGTSLTDGLPPAAGAIVASNGDTTANLIALYDDSTLKFGIADGGVMTWATTEGTPGSDAMTILNGPTGTAGNPDKFMIIVVGGTSYVIPAWSI